MAIIYKVDIIAALKGAGFSSYRIRKECLIGERTMTQLRHGELVSWETMNRLCSILQCQPGDLLEYVSDDETRKKL